MNGWCERSRREQAESESGKEKGKVRGQNGDADFFMFLSTTIT
jgi:hypothetical protein